MQSASNSAPRNVVLLGAGHGSIALARSLRRSGMNAWLIAEETSSASFSNAITRFVRWKGPLERDALATLESIAQLHGLAGSILIPAGDPEVHLVAGAHDRLSATFELLTNPWDQLRWACDKGLAYERAAALGIGVPRSYDCARMSGKDRGTLPFPLVLKPSMRLRQNRFTVDRAWRVDDVNALEERYREACELVGAESVIAQQLVRGAGKNQLSYAGVWNQGEPIASLTARRLRQYPPEFARTSTHVETADLPQVVEAAETFLRSIRHHGLVEVEFKLNDLDGTLNLLDVNPRPWNWLGLAGAAGIDLGAAIASIRSGHPVRPVKARTGVAWIFMSRDLAAASASGRFRPHAILGYASTFLRVRSCACFSWNDPLPGLVDLPLAVARSLQRRFRSATSAASRPAGT